MLAVVAPGQGAQKSGFLTEWLEIDSFASRLHWFSSVTGLDLKFYGTEASDEQIRDTSVAQPLLVASAIATALEAFEGLDSFFSAVDLVAGHSVGELAVAGLSGAISLEAALVLVRERGRYMAEAAKLTETSMTAVLAGNQDDVLARLDELGLTPANYNGAGQIVAAGTVEQLAGLTNNPPARTKLRPLSVAGAFHTKHMLPAVDKLAKLADAICSSGPKMMLLSNLDGNAVESGQEFLTRLVRQVAEPVRWDLCMDTMEENSITGILELAPAGTLTGIARRNLKNVERFNLNTPEDLSQAKDFIAAHSGKEKKTS